MTIHNTQRSSGRRIFLTLASIVVGSTVWMTAWGCGRASMADIGEPAVPVELEVPHGTLLRLTLDDTLSSHESSVGESFVARVEQEVSIDGRVAIPYGAVVRGRVTEAHEAHKVGGRAALGVAFETLETGDGGSLPIAASLRRIGKSEKVKDGAIIAGATAAGAILGESIDKGEGGVIGGILGGIGGAFAAKETGGKPIEILAGTGLAIELEAPMTVVVSG